jgi:hypothetical protein
MDFQTEFDRQTQNLIQKGYPAAAGLSEMEFLHIIEPLKLKLSELNVPEADLDRGIYPL